MIGPAMITLRAARRHRTTRSRAASFRACAIPALLFAALLCHSIAPAQAASDRPAAFMRHVSKQLIAASRTRSPHVLASVIRRYGDIPDIGLYSLGSYRSKLPSSRRGSYYDGVARFLARYFLDQARNYPIAKVDIHAPSKPADWGHKVDSRVTLANGSSYNVRWLVVPRGKGFKVRDLSILGFWMTPFQKRLFENYISDNGGNVNALLAALGG
ncbi:MAG: hypothetical protein Kow0032_14550 [Methyloligellaceae bacterium]